MEFRLGLIVAAVMGSLTLTEPITRVSVTKLSGSEEPKVIKVLAPAERADFQRHWDNKQTVKSAFADVGGENYFLDIKCEDSGGRWLYKTTGYVQFITKNVTPVYKLGDPESFNKLIGAVK
jgi:hypothetical protein